VADADHERIERRLNEQIVADAAIVRNRKFVFAE
jgi:hypothetical protein